MRLCKLPAPDMLEFNLPPDTRCVITDDGTPLTAQLAGALSDRGWPVSVLPLPHVASSQRPPLPSNVPVLGPVEPGASGITSALQSCGPISAFIYLHPRVDGEMFSGEEKALARQLFFLAQHLKGPLHEAALRGRSCFVSVARLDGKLGLGGCRTFGAIGGGLFGLTKTLALEWPDVFCRAIDISPDCSADQAAEAIIAELHDPNRLIVETGWDPLGRVTLVAQEPEA